MKIMSIALENVKRCKAVQFSPKPSGATVIGGNNSAGKTSILDAIVYALGGEKMRPTNLKRDDSIGQPIIHIETDDGLVIERRGKNSELHVTDSTGKRAGQTLLDSLVSKFALDLPKFMNSPSDKKTQMLLDLIPEKDELLRLDADYKAKENTRLMVGREADKKRKAAEDLPFYEDAPEKPLSVSDLIKEQQAILARNGIRAEHRANLDRYKNEVDDIDRRIADLTSQRAELVDKINGVQCAVADEGEDESTAELEQKIADFESINAKVAANAARAERLEEASDLDDQYKSLSNELANIKKARVALLSNAKLPYPNLSISPDTGELTLNGKSWDCMSGSQQLVVAASIASRMNPKCRFVLLDKTEQLDAASMDEFDKWCEAEDIQCICTRVSTGGECSIIIEDGEVAVNNLKNETQEEEY